MHFDPDNNVVKLCAVGMSLEGEARSDEASELFQLAWNEATNDFEKFIAAHYLARHQESVSDKLKWDTIALNLAKRVDNNDLSESYPSLYLNIARCYEDLNDFESAWKNYQLANSFENSLPDDEYGRMIRSGIARGIKRIKLVI